jgi:hypothetical protein
MHAVLAVPTGRTRIGGLVRRLKLQRPVWTMRPTISSHGNDMLIWRHLGPL